MLIVISDIAIVITITVYDISRYLMLFSHREIETIYRMLKGKY